MSNQVTATIFFSFRGETHRPALELDLDQYMQSAGRIPDLYPLIATANGFDLYSYEFEMMQAETIAYSNAKGLVADYIVDGVLDLNAFEPAWHQHQILESLELIARQHMHIDRLSEHADLKAALLDAYELGHKKFPQDQ